MEWSQNRCFEIEFNHTNAMNDAYNSEYICIVYQTCLSIFHSQASLYVKAIERRKEWRESNLPPVFSPPPPAEIVKVTPPPPPPLILVKVPPFSTCHTVLFNLKNLLKLEKRQKQFLHFFTFDHSSEF